MIIGWVFEHEVGKDGLEEIEIVEENWEQSELGLGEVLLEEDGWSTEDRGKSSLVETEWGTMTGLLEVIWVVGVVKYKGIDPEELEVETKWGEEEMDSF